VRDKIEALYAEIAVEQTKADELEFIEISEKLDQHETPALVT
jgi:hypothetical protein